MQAEIEEKLEKLMKEAKGRKEKLGFVAMDISTPKQNFYFPNIHTHTHINRYYSVPKPPLLRPALSMPLLPKKPAATVVGSKRPSDRLNQSLSRPPSNQEESKDLFPGWLRARSDFQELYKKYDIFDAIDVFKICLKPPPQRNEIEHRAIISWAKICPFFSVMTEEQLDIVASKLKAKQFSKGVTLIRKGEAGDCMYVIVEGVVGVYLAGDKPIDEIIAKNVVGEAAMRTNSVRTATIIAHTTLKVLKLMKEDYERVMFKDKLQEVFQFIRALPLFADWPISRLQRLSSLIMVKQYEPGQNIYQIGEVPMDLYIVKEGKVGLWMEVSTRKENRWPSSLWNWEVVVTEKVFQKRVRECEERDVFGEIELLDGVGRQTRAVSDGMSVLYLLRVEQLMDSFAEKDKKKLRTYNQTNPSKEKLLETVIQDRQKISKYSKALLNALNTNSLPSGRGLFMTAADRRRLHLARRIMSREHKKMSGFFVSQSKATHLEVLETPSQLNLTL
jgi:CRP-like cAMP-binding protein